jgi:hypothetical protein
MVIAGRPGSGRDEVLTDGMAMEEKIRVCVTLRCNAMSGQDHSMPQKNAVRFYTFLGVGLEPAGEELQGMLPQPPMRLTFCIGCLMPLTFRPETAGRKARCPHCGRKQRLPEGPIQN